MFIIIVTLGFNLCTTILYSYVTKSMYNNFKNLDTLDMMSGYVRLLLMFVARHKP